MSRSQLTLKHFILQERAVRLYRQFLRASRCSSTILFIPLPPSETLLDIPDPVSRQETISWVRGDFEKLRTISEVVSCDSVPKLALTHDHG
jgi:hypothetical protein